MPNSAEAQRQRRQHISFFRFFGCCVRRRDREKKKKKKTEEKKKQKRLSAKQQEGRAMATLDRQIPSPDTFLCEPRSSFVSAAKLRFVDNSSSDNSDKELYRLGEAVSLGKEGEEVALTEMLGYRALEDCCLVVCHVCNQVVTPQGILTH
ncbi:ataxin-7-like protein 1 [Cyclopterus lumpus]|uniref:ataxin-7-like protein 1 n=1 Tax=Cyclopterus lumpus TaxID=8103 RepID=UPI0014864171|nr:ataxin-7-like protein 1 [Cyclopterus lumpus]